MPLAQPDEIQVADEAIVVRPGDTLILRYSRPLSAQHVENLKRQLREELPDVRTVIVQADGMAVYRTEDD